MTEIEKGHDNQRRGMVNEYKVAVYLLEKGYDVAKPYLDEQKYDILVDFGNGFERVQVKTGREINGIVRCRVQKRKYNTTILQQYTDKDIDSFIIFCQDNNKLYRIGIEEYRGTVDVCLRVQAPKNNQKASILWAKDFEI